MNLEFYKTAANKQLSAWKETIYQKAINATDKQMLIAQCAAIAVMAGLTCKLAYESSYNGIVSNTWVTNMIVISAMEKGLRYVEAARTTKKISDFVDNLLKDQIKKEDLHSRA